MPLRDMQSILDILKPIGSEQVEEVQSKESMAAKTNNKRALLTDYITNQSAQREDFDKIISTYPEDVPYSVFEALNYCECNLSNFPRLNLIYNNLSNFYRKDIGAYLLKYAKETNYYNMPFTKTFNYINNPYYDIGITNKEFAEIWKALRQKYPTIKEADKALICSTNTIDDLKYQIGYNSDQSKSKIQLNDTEVAPQLDLSTPKTKGDLYRYYYNLSLLYANYQDNIFGNISSENSSDLLKDIRAIFLTLYTSTSDPNVRLIHYNTPFGEWIKTVTEQTFSLKSNQFLVTSICTSPTHNGLTDLSNALSNIFDKVLSVTPKDSIIVPVDIDCAKLFGIESFNKLVYYKYNKHIIAPNVLSNDPEQYKSLYNLIHNNDKVSVKRVNTYTTNDLLNRLQNPDIFKKDAPNQQVSIDISSTNTNQLSDIAPDTFQYSNHEYTYPEFKEILKDLKEYNIVYASRCIIDGRRGLGKNGIPYIVMRKGKDKRFYYLNPTITIGYSTHKDYMVEEPLDRLYCYDNVSLKDLYKLKMHIKDHFKDSDCEPIFYNTDFSYNTYITSEIRNRMHYKEGTSTPRTLVLDFETEMNAIKVKGASQSIDAKCRMVSLFDLYDKRFYCAVIKDQEYHKDVSFKDLKEHDGYPVQIDEYYDERDLWKWLNQKLYELDPDIITGWNVEGFDLTYAIVRCKTLDMQLKSKYGPFCIIKTKDGKGRDKFAVGADGIVVMDYRKLYRACQYIKRENYKLEYICQVELNKGKREMVIDNHNEMYFKYLREYVLYNIEDDERILDLENKLNYLKFQFEMCNVCNISWDDIFSKTKLIDGLVYNHAWDTNKTLLKERNLGAKENINLKNILSKDVQEYVDETGILTINDDEDSIDLTEYTDEEDVDPNDKGYEGAVVLMPQKGVKDLVADLDASQMYPRLMIRSNIFKDTLCGVIAIDNEKYAEQWLYDRDNFPNEILIKKMNDGINAVTSMNKAQFEDFLKDKILTPFGTIYYKPSVKRSLVSDILINLIHNRSKYKKLRNEATGKYTQYKADNDTAKMEEYSRLIDRYDNLQTAYKSLINSFYGVMGMIMYRLADVFSAASITASGRELTRMVAHHASKFMDAMIHHKDANISFDKAPITCKTLVGLEKISNRSNVLYGDTDSIFVHIGNVINAVYGANIPLEDKLNHSWEVIDKVADYINFYVIKDILARKNIDFDDEDKDYNYDFKKEIIMSKVLFGTQKKHYAMHIAIKEGKRLDKIDIKGMLAIKSDTPRFSRELLKELTEYILKKYDPNNSIKSNEMMLEMYRTSMTKADKLIASGDISIGRPVSLTQDIQYYSTIQAHIRGMLLYDIIYGHEFLFGDKGYQYYVADINWNKIGMTEQQLLDAFKAKYGKMKWYPEMMRTYSKEVFFSSITVPSDVEVFDTKAFVIDAPKTKKTLIKDKVQTLMNLVGIMALDKDDEVKLKRNSIKKFDFSTLPFDLSSDKDSSSKKVSNTNDTANKDSSSLLFTI